MPIDPSAYVAPTAKVDPEAVIGPQTRIGEFCVIERDVVIGARCVLEPYVFVRRWTTIGDDNEISAGAALGTDPFDRNFTGERSYLVIGHRNRIREHFTISRGTAPESVTRVGDDNFIMSSGHIAHNAEVGNRTVIASCALVAGHVVVEDQAFISGCVVVHQHCRIGRLAMIGGGVRVNQDLPPFFLYSGVYASPVGLNLVGLRRAGFSADDIAAIKRAYRLLYRSKLKLKDALERIEREIDSPCARHIVEFVRGTRRGIAHEHEGRARFRFE